jgi:uroporphyrin-3 C-methyltransferase
MSKKFMSDKKSNPDENAPEDDAAFPDPEPLPQIEAPPQAKKSGGLVAWAALLVALVAAAGVGWDFLMDREAGNSASDATARLEARINEVVTSVGASQDIVTALEQSVSEIRRQEPAREAAISRIEQQLDDRLRQLEPLPARLATVEASMAALQGISTGARDAWLLAEAEYYMQIANVQLQLARNPELALLALNHADERVLQLGDPRLTGVRQALADEKRALEAMEKTDIAGITLTLASLAATVDSLPLRQDTEVRGDTETTAVDPTLTGMERAMASLRNAVDGIVSVRRADEVMEPLIAPEAEFFLRANLALQIQTARLALLRGEETVFRQSLDDVDQWLADYYDVDSTAVQSARTTITSIRGSAFNVALPDISRSLRLLRQFNSLSDAAAQPADDAEETAAPDNGEEPE